MQAGYSSVGRASDCRNLQQSDGSWFDSGWPDFSTDSIAQCLCRFGLSPTSRHGCHKDIGNISLARRELSLLEPRWDYSALR